MKKINETKDYVKPEVEAVDIIPTSVLCDSATVEDPNSPKVY